MESKCNRASSQVILGVLVIGVGVLFLLDNLDILDFHHAIGFWPLAFIAAGVIAMAGDGPRSGRHVGVLLFALGVLMIVGRLGLFDVEWAMVWPLVLIALGGLILYRTLGRGRAARSGLEDGVGVGIGDVGNRGNVNDTVDVVAILGAVERRLRTPDFRGGEITALMGGCALDLRESSIAREAMLNVFAIWGGINIKVPPDWTVVMNGTPVMGGFVDKTIAAPDTGKRLVVTGYVIMGGVEVRN